jgi:hypothetical protein
MVKIPDDVKKLIETQGIFAVGSVGGNKFANVSPRIFFVVKEESIFWLDFFHHKSYHNFKVNPWITVAAYDKNELNGFQLRGIVSFITDEPEKSKIRNEIIEKTLQNNNSEKVKKMTEKDAEVILFEPKVVYSLSPEKYSDLSIGSDIDSTQLY